ncbi:Uncharacterised protein [Mycobacteroides abscessus]|nr:Uncharacterised protein [Mycobacteroides abscessus]
MADAVRPAGARSPATVNTVTMTGPTNRPVAATATTTAVSEPPAAASTRPAVPTRSPAANVIQRLRSPQRRGRATTESAVIAEPTPMTAYASPALPGTPASRVSAVSAAWVPPNSRPMASIPTRTTASRRTSAAVPPSAAPAVVACGPWPWPCGAVARAVGWSANAAPNTAMPPAAASTATWGEPADARTPTRAGPRTKLTSSAVLS